MRPLFANRYCRLRNPATMSHAKDPMKHLRLFSKASLFAGLLFLPLTAHAQGTLADYQRAGALRAKYQAVAVNIPEAPSWLDGTRFWYRKSVPGGHEFVM